MYEATKGERRRQVKSILFLGVSFLTLAVVLTGAIFTEDQAVGGNTFQSGTVDISTTPATAVVSYDPMVPGDSTVSVLDVHNAGTVELRYSIKSTTTEATLSAQLDLTIWDEAEEADAGTTCASTAPVTDLYGPGDLGTTTGSNVVGDPTQGGQLGDRTLAANGHHYLCFKVSLPLATGNAYQGLTTTATLDFHAEQTTNN